MEITNIHEREITVVMGAEEARMLGTICQTAAGKMSVVSGDQYDVCMTLSSLFDVAGLAAVAYSYTPPKDSEKLTLENWKEGAIGSATLFG